jgi:hypothetical protein
MTDNCQRESIRDTDTLHRENRKKLAKRRILSAYQADIREPNVTKPANITASS